MNCPACGAAVKEGRFCIYCGAKLPDDTKRIEISKRIEDVAEMKRADYETEESLLRQREAKIKLSQLKAKRVSSLVALILSVIVLIIGITNLYNAVFFEFMVVVGAVNTIVMLFYIVKQLITGKW